MKTLWNSFKVAFAMFSKIPMPRADWNKENMKYMFCFFPWIGVIIGGLEAVVCFGLNYFGYNKTFTAMVMLLIPLFLTGGIHIDGLLDTSDALSSWRERERRLEILKDSHAGAFAIIACCTYFLVSFASMTELTGNGEAVIVLCIGFVLSRCLSGYGVLTIPKATKSGTVAEFSRNSSDKIVRIVLIIYMVAILVAMLFVSPYYGVGAFLTAILVFIYYRNTAMKYFGGTTGDLSGFFLCVCEASMAFVLAIMRVLI